MNTIYIAIQFIDTVYTCATIEVNVQQTIEMNTEDQAVIVSEIARILGCSRVLVYEHLGAQFKLPTIQTLPEAKHAWESAVNPDKKDLIRIAWIKLAFDAIHQATDTKTLEDILSFAPNVFVEDAVYCKWVSVCANIGQLRRIYKRINHERHPKALQSLIQRISITLTRRIDTQPSVP
jgi:predicted DNA-binding transcriptional regulator AlpA